MRSTFLLLALCTTSLAAPLPFPKPRAQDESDLGKLQGEWEMKQEWGYEHRPRVVTRTTVSVKGDRMAFLVDGKVVTNWVVTLDPKKSPREIDLRRVKPSGAVSADPLLAVYRLDGDYFLFAHGNKRPTDLGGEQDGELVTLCKRKR